MLQVAISWIHEGVHDALTIYTKVNEHEVQVTDNLYRTTSWLKDVESCNSWIHEVVHDARVGFCKESPFIRRL